MFQSQSTLNVPTSGSIFGDRSAGIRGSASTSNLNGNSGGGSGWGGEQNTFGQSQYEPGYLLSATTSAGGPSYPAPPLIPDPVSGKRPVSMHAKFGTEPFAETFRASSIPPRGQSIVPDDENAPPSNSLLEGLSTPDMKKPYRHSMAGGFYSSTSSPIVPQQPSSTNPTISAPSSSIIIFGFPPHLAHEVIAHFQSMGETLSIDTSALENGGGRNWVVLAFKNSWEAARAVRRSGEVLSIGREEFMVGVKWADNGSSSTEFNENPTSPIQSTEQAPQTPSRSGPSIGRPITLAPSRSAFKSHSHPAAAATDGKSNDWGVALRNEASGVQPQQGGGQGQGVWGRVSDMVFGW